MAYQPTHPHPYLESIDATNPLEKIFSVVINPKDVIVKYDFSIYEMQTVTDSEDETSTKETLVSVYNKTHSFTEAEWLYGSESGTLLTIEVLDDFEMTNGKNYQWKIVLYDVTDASVESPMYYFSTKAMPVITLDVDDKITTCEYTFKATYSQEQNESYMYYQYALYRDNVLIDETAEKIDSLLSYTYSGFVSGSKYKIDLIIATPDRKTYKVSRPFEVEYEEQPSLLASDVYQVLDKNCIEVDYSQNISVKGNTDGDIQHGEFLKDAETPKYVYGASIPNGESIYYHKINETKPLSLGEDFTVYYSVHFSELFVGDIIRLTNEDTGKEYVVNYDGRNFYYKIGDNDRVAIDPYVDKLLNHREESIVHNLEISSEEMEELKNLSPEELMKALNVDFDALYVLDDGDEIFENSFIIYNDITANFWWTIVLLPDKVLAYRSQKYLESVVS